MAAGAVTAAPYLLLYIGPWNDAGHSQSLSGDWLYWLAFLGAPFLGSMVFTLLCRQRPEWLDGVGFAFVAALAGGGVWGSQMRDEGVRIHPFSLPAALYLGAAMFVFGMGGAAFATLLSRPILKERWDGKRKRFKTWHLGTAVAAVELVAVAVLAAIGL